MLYWCLTCHKCCWILWMFIKIKRNKTSPCHLFKILYVNWLTLTFLFKRKLTCIHLTFHSMRKWHGFICLSQKRWTCKSTWVFFCNINLTILSWRVLSQNGIFFYWFLTWFFRFGKLNKQWVFWIYSVNKCITLIH